MEGCEYAPAILGRKNQRHTLKGLAQRGAHTHTRTPLIVSTPNRESERREGVEAAADG